jgi:hypothetical protein
MRLSVKKFATQPGIQPRGGFLSPKLFEVSNVSDEFDEAFVKAIEDSYGPGIVSPATRGVIVDYLTRAMIHTLYQDKNPVGTAFRIPLMGARARGDESLAMEHIKAIEGELVANLDNPDYSILITHAYQLTAYDSFVRCGLYDETIKDTTPNEADIDGISRMVQIAYSYFKEGDDFLHTGISFLGAYTKQLAASDCDITTLDSLIDLKTSKSKPSAQDTFQLLLYYILGLQEKPGQFGGMDYIKILNPRLNKLYSLDVDDISQDLIEEVERLIGSSELSRL